MIEGKCLQAVKRLSVLLLFALLLPIQGYALNRPAAVRLSGSVLETTPAKVTVDDLEKLPLTTYTTTNPFEKKRVTYTGVLLKDLVASFASPSCNKVTLTARDDYQVVFVKAEWQRWDLLLATRTEGKTMSISESGPVKIVMPYDTAEDIDQDIYTSKWIWLIKSIEFQTDQQGK